MKNPVSSFFLPFMAIGMFCCACNSADVESVDSGVSENEVAVRIAVPGWNNLGTRAGGDMLYPINVLIAPKDDNEIVKTVTITSGTEFGMKIANGTYDVFAVCGLPTDIMPRFLSDCITVPDDANGGKTDFAAGSSNMTVMNGVSDPAVLNITAERQMAWLDIEIGDVPENIASFSVYVKGIYEKYSLDGKWNTVGNEKNNYAKIALTNSAGVYKGSAIIAPSANSSRVTYVAEATTENGYTSILTYTSSTPLNAGSHLVQTLKYNDLTIVEGGISIDDWINETDDGTLSNQYVFEEGDQYFSLPATVINVNSSQNTILVVGHKPLRVTLDEMREWDFKDIPYDLLPEINVQRWAFPTSLSIPLRLLNAISEIGEAAFDAQFTASGNTPIDRSKVNVLAYNNKNEGTYYVYDFGKEDVVPVTDTSAEFLIYPVGIIQLAE